MAGERRRYLRVLFEETIQVEAAEWTDPMATGLDISLNGTRFHCEHSLTEGERVTIVFRPELKLIGEVRWCWPIEWYYQAAVEFVDMTEADKSNLRDYIQDTTGEPYPEYSEVEKPAPPKEPEEEEDDQEEDLGLAEDSTMFEEDHLFDADALDTGDGPELEDGLSPTTFANRKVVIAMENEAQSNLVASYLIKRTQFECVRVSSLDQLWQRLKEQPVDLILLSRSLDEEDPIVTLRDIHDRLEGLPVILISGVVSLEERLRALNAGAADYLTRPVHVSGIAQSIILTFAHMEAHQESHRSLMEENDGFEMEDEELSLQSDEGEEFHLTDD